MLCTGARTTLCRRSSAILYICQRHSSMEELAKQLKVKRERMETYKEINEGPENLVDPLEFRNVGEFKKTLFKDRNSKSTSFNFLDRNSIFRGVKNKSILSTVKNIMAKTRAKDQSYNPERVRTLGPDLAAAHFIVCRGGGVKLVGEDKFIRAKINRSSEVLPNHKDPHVKVEAIDFSGGDFVYEAVSNLADLKYLSWISFRNCKYVDNWLLDHLSSVAQTVEYIDLSGCRKIDQFGLSCLYRFKKLRCVNVEDVSDSPDFNLTCLTMEAEIPDFVFIGLKLKPTPKSVFNDS